MVVNLVESTFLLNFLSYGASVLGLFLGIAGMIALQGFDGFFYSIGFLIAYLVVLYLVAEPLRNLGKYTLADMINARFDARKVRGAAALSTITIVLF